MNALLALDPLLEGPVSWSVFLVVITRAAFAITAGKHTIEFDFNYSGLGFATLAHNDLSGIGKAGTGTLPSFVPGGTL